MLREESREGVRAAMKSSFKLDGNESPAMRKEIALGSLSADVPGKEQGRGEAGRAEPALAVFRVQCHALKGRAGLEPHSQGP